MQRTFTSEPPLKSGRYSRNVRTSKSHVQASANDHNGLVKNQLNNVDKTIKTILVPDDEKMFGGGDGGAVNINKLEEQNPKRAPVKHLVRLFDAMFTTSAK